MHESPSYAGADYIGIKRTGASELIGVAQTPLAAGFLGLARCSARSSGPGPRGRGRGGAGAGGA